MTTGATAALELDPWPGEALFAALRATHREPERDGDDILIDCPRCLATQGLTLVVEPPGVHCSKCSRDPAALAEGLLECLARFPAGVLAAERHEVTAFLARAREQSGGSTTKAPTIPTLASLVDRLVPLGEKLVTGFATLDTNHRGGMRPGRFAVIGGAPGAGKTSLAIDMAVRWAQAGIYVVVLAADESPEGILVRIGQQLGFDREELENAVPESLARFREALGELPTLVLLDAADGATVESAGAVLAGAYGHAVLIVDSLQRARASGSDEADTPRGRVDAVLAACQTIARRGVLVIATSELARGAYRSRDASERTDDLAATKESGGIEYAAGTLLILRSVPEEVGLIDVTVPKNRGGDRTPFRLTMDFTRARLHETALPEGCSGAIGPGLDAATQLATDITAARNKLREHPGVTGKWALASYLEGMSRSRQDRAISALLEAGEIEDRGQSRRPRWYLKGEHSPQLPVSPRGSQGGTYSPSSPRSIGAGSYGGSAPGERGDERLSSVAGDDVPQEEIAW